MHLPGLSRALPCVAAQSSAHQQRVNIPVTIILSHPNEASPVSATSRDSSASASCRSTFGIKNRARRNGVVRIGFPTWAERALACALITAARPALDQGTLIWIRAQKRTRTSPRRTPGRFLHAHPGMQLVVVGTPVDLVCVSGTVKWSLRRRCPRCCLLPLRSRVARLRAACFLRLETEAANDLSLVFQLYDQRTAACVSPAGQGRRTLARSISTRLV